MQYLLLLILSGFMSFGKMPLNDPCLNYKTKTYQVFTTGVDKSKVDSIIANSKISPFGYQTFKNGKLVFADYQTSIQYGFPISQMTEQYYRNEKGDVLLEIRKFRDRSDSTIYTYNEKGKLIEWHKKTFSFREPLSIIGRCSYSNDTMYRREYRNGEYQITEAAWEQQKNPKIDAHQIIHPKKSDNIQKMVWDEYQNIIETINCENDSCYTVVKIDYLYDKCGRILRRTNSYEPGKIWSIEWNEIIE